jgi:hypothetical protein
MEVLTRLEQHPLTPKDALRFGVYRLAARVFELREAGHEIATVWEDDGERRYARYYLIRHAPRVVA